MTTLINKKENFDKTITAFNFTPDEIEQVKKKSIKQNVLVKNKESVKKVEEEDLLFNFTTDDIESVRKHKVIDKNPSTKRENKLDFTDGQELLFNFTSEDNVNIRVSKNKNVIKKKIKKESTVEDVVTKDSNLLKKNVKAIRSTTDVKEQRSILKRILNGTVQMTTYAGSATVKAIDGPTLRITGAVLKRVGEQYAANYLGVSAPMVKLATDLTINLSSATVKSLYKNKGKTVKGDTIKAFVGTVSNNLTPLLGNGYGAMAVGAITGSTVNFVINRFEKKPKTTEEMATILEGPTKQTKPTNQKGMVDMGKESLKRSITGHAIASGVAALATTGYAAYMGHITMDQALSLVPSREGVINLVKKKLSGSMSDLANDAVPMLKNVAKLTGKDYATQAIQKYSSSAKEKAKKYVTSITKKWELSSKKVIPNSVRQALERRAFSRHMYDMTIGDIMGVTLDAGTQFGSMIVADAAVNKASDMINDPMGALKGATDMASSVSDTIQTTMNDAIGMAATTSDKLHNVVNGAMDIAMTASGTLQDTYDAVADRVNDLMNSSGMNNDLDAFKDAMDFQDTIKKYEIDNDIAYKVKSATEFKEAMDFQNTIERYKVENDELKLASDFKDSMDFQDTVNKYRFDNEREQLATSFDEALAFDESRKYYTGYSQYRDFYENSIMGKITDNVLSDDKTMGVGYETLINMGGWGVGTYSKTLDWGRKVAQGAYYGKMALSTTADAATLYDLKSAEGLNYAEENVNNVGNYIQKETDKWKDSYDSFLKRDSDESNDSIINSLYTNQKDNMFRIYTGQKSGYGRMIFGDIYDK